MKRAVGIIRVSEIGGRNGDRFHSPDIQRERIERDCANHGLELAEIIEELDVSGGKPLQARKGLSRALAAVESGQIHAIVFAYRDRVDRSIDTASELCRRMDQAEGLLIADGRVITHATHDGWRQATFESFLNEDQRRAISAKMLDVHRRSISRGVAPFRLPLGYRRRDDGVAEPDPETAALAVEAWERRAAGESLPVIRAWLIDEGARLSLNTVTRMLQSRFYLGELHYKRAGVVPNLRAHEPLIDPDTYARAQLRRGELRGRHAKSPHLLARLGVLRCGCGTRMSLSARGQGRTGAYYRCSNRECSARVTIDARIAEEAVTKAVKDALRTAQGRASIAESAQEAVPRLERAQDDLDSALRVFALTGAENEPAAVERIADLVKVRDDARAEVDRIGPDRAETINLVDDWERLTLDERRDIIRATIRSATVTREGRGIGRVKCDPFR